jgi:hypothetical protein
MRGLPETARAAMALRLRRRRSRIPWVFSVYHARPGHSGGREPPAPLQLGLPARSEDDAGGWHQRSTVPAGEDGPATPEVERRAGTA